MGKWFAKSYDRVMMPLEKWRLHAIRRRLISDAVGTVLEIGSGTGLNFTYYRQADRVIAIEPDQQMLAQSLERAKIAQVPVEVVQGSAEQLPFTDNTFDTVAGTLVLCTIPDPKQALSEVRRVLKPGGQILFFEHVRHHHPLWGNMQDWINPVWKRMCDGCNLNRNSGDLIEQAGFQIQHSQWFLKDIFVAVQGVNSK